ncbi:uncharacterized protein LOC143035767 [Oratosquilla oratoria]|uniref:uncharacterized protein LOC143035767 n=1 Tax=Oratosquilla oratoria TaxID=337810 RepID=UPI003F75EEBF
MDRVTVFLMALVALLAIPSHSHGSPADGHPNQNGKGHKDHGKGHAYGHDYFNHFFKSICTGNPRRWESPEGCPYHPVSWFSSTDDFRPLLECSSDPVPQSVSDKINFCHDKIENIQNTNDGWFQDQITDYVFYWCFMKEMGFNDDTKITESDFTSIFDSWPTGSVKESLIDTMELCFALTENPRNKVQWFLDVMACYATKCHGIVGSTAVGSCDLEIDCIKGALMSAAQFYYDFDTSEFGDFEDNPFTHLEFIVLAIMSSLSDNCGSDNPIVYLFLEHFFLDQDPDYTDMGRKKRATNFNLNRNAVKQLMNIKAPKET